TGSGEMPPEVRQMMVDQMYKEGIGYLTQGTGQYDPTQILSTREIAAVFVQGAIQPMAAQGSHFDLHLTALPGTDTTSIANGLLWPADLRIHIEPGNESDVIAQGRGPVFCPLFDASGTQLRTPDAITRTGEVLGGGVVTQSIPLTLQLYTPSFRMSAILERTINEHFGSGPPPTAVAQSDSQITLNIPPAYQDDPSHFVDLVLHLYPGEVVPGFSQSQAEVLIEALRDPTAPHDQIATTLSELGRPIIPLLREQYASNNPDVRFYAAKAGTLIGDEEAIQILCNLAVSEHGLLQQQAVDTLEVSNDQVNATLAFTKLIMSSDQNQQLLGFNGLCAINSPSIYTQLVAGKFTMNVVACDANSFIYATTSQSQVIAIVGRVPSLVPGTLYISPDNVLTVNYPFPSTTAPSSAAADKTPVQLYYDDPLTHNVVQMNCAPALPDIITALGSAPNPFSPNYDPREKYIALSYQRMVEMLYSLCRDHELDAQFILESATQNQQQLYAALNSPRVNESTMTDQSVQQTQDNSTSNVVVPTGLPGEITPPADSNENNAADQNQTQQDNQQQAQQNNQQAQQDSQPGQIGSQDQFANQLQGQGAIQPPQ
ncbi:MAG TPA: flagellar basal body P-ring protein FlgI, partial [Phycisphaerae bacterium]|nr:flagellar basal body P-ring protein FlgI [Phycisphaerae bacterium]